MWCPQAAQRQKGPDLPEGVSSQASRPWSHPRPVGTLPLVWLSRSLATRGLLRSPVHALSAAAPKGGKRP
jgi:hypothetical protein